MTDRAAIGASDDELLDEPTATPLGIGSAHGPDAGPVAASLRLDQIIFDNGDITGDGTGQTIAIISAYHATTAASDLDAFSTQFVLPALIQFAQAERPPRWVRTRNGVGGHELWAMETALDVQWAHALAPGEPSVGRSQLRQLQ